jgi:hypothetical protein
MTDSFWDVRAQEAEELRRITNAIEGNERALGLANRIMALRESSGFQDMVKAVEDLIDHNDQQMVACMASDSMLRVLQGKSQALRDILKIFGNTENTVAHLVRRQEELQNALVDAERRRPKQRQEVAG